MPLSILFSKPSSPPHRRPSSSSTSSSSYARWSHSPLYSPLPCTVPSPSSSDSSLSSNFFCSFSSPSAPSFSSSSPCSSLKLGRRASSGSSSSDPSSALLIALCPLFLEFFFFLLLLFEVLSGSFFHNFLECDVLNGAASQKALTHLPCPFILMFSSLTGAVFITVRIATFIKLSILVRVPLKVYPFLSSTITYDSLALPRYVSGTFVNHSLQQLAFII